ncbi:MAG TPA: hypothetical protein DCS60_04330 [Opitutae bacterium]|nr:hypothetical protein [Opitutae bacterium]
MTDFEGIQSIQFFRVLAGFEPKLRFLISKYPSGMPQVESRNLCFESYVVRSKANYWKRSGLGSRRLVGYGMFSKG